MVLRWDNVDLENGFINIREQVIQDKTNHQLIHTRILKTNSAFRSISIPNNLVKLLIEHKNNQPNSNIDGFVILNRDNVMCNPRNVSNGHSQRRYRSIKS